MRSKFLFSVMNASGLLASTALALSVSTVTHAATSIFGTPTTAATAQRWWAFQPWATDTDHRTVSYTIRNKPYWASFDTQYGHLYGVPSNANIGTYSNIVITASDGVSSASLPPFSLTVKALGGTTGGSGGTTTPQPPTTPTPPTTPPTTGAGIANAVVLDNFSEGMRTLGGHNLWDIYTGEGAAGSTSVNAASGHFAAQGLDYHTTAGPVYMHFYVNNGFDWLFAHQETTSGTWEPTINRMAFWVYMPAGMNAAGGNGHSVELGTYTRCTTCDATTQNAGGSHWYHEYNPLPGVWTYVVMDDHPQHWVGGPTTDPGLARALSDGSNYMTALTRFYWNDLHAGTQYPTDVRFSGFQFYTEANVGDVAHIASLEASYNPSTHLLHVGFVRNASEDSTADTTYTASWATSDIDTLGFSNATPLGSVGPDGQGDYVNKKIEGTVNLAGVSTIYIAVQKKGSTLFREIPLRIN